MITVTVHPGQPQPPSVDEMRATLARYQRRLPAQIARREVALIDVASAKAKVEAAEQELAAADLALKTINTYIADLSAKIGV